MKTFIITLTIVGMLLTISCLALADDKSDKLNQESSYTFSPGYINAAKYQAESLKVKIPDYKEKGFFEKAVEYVKGRLGYSAKQEQAAGQDLNPELQKKSSGTNPETLTANAANQLIDSAQYNVAIGSGTNQIRDANNRLISEVVNGTRYVYAGFNNVGKTNIADAIAAANAGDKVVVKSGTYNGGIVVKNGVSLFGGYNENGIRDVRYNATIINGVIQASSINKSTEINGFTVNGGNIRHVNGMTYNVGIYAYSSSNLTIKNNIFTESINATNGVGILAWAQATVSNNIFNSTGGILVTGGISKTGFLISSNNNYNGRYGIAAGWATTVSSSGDYYAKGTSVNNWRYMVSAPGAVTIQNSTATPNRINEPNIATTPALIVPAYVLENYYKNNLNDSNQFQNNLSNLGNSKTFDSDKMAGILGGLLANKRQVEQAQGLNPELMIKIIRDAKGSVSASVPIGEVTPQDMELATKLASILANPTEDQKVVIDSITSLLNDLENLQKETGANPELAKASSDLLQMVANVLLAQAIPDLLKEGDIQGIKGIFSQLDSGKSKVILEYKEATKPYYEEVKKLIEKNASVLDIDLNLKNLIQKELKEIPRSEIDKILEKLKNKANKSFAEEYILQQEEKAKAKYIDPNKKKLEENMKKMLEDFTKKLSTTLEAKK